MHRALTAGGGLEWMFWPNVSAKVEYLYYDLGSVSYVVGAPTVNSARCGFCTGNGPCAPLVDAKTRFHVHIVRAGVNYHFNWGAPTVATY
jgi:outer membrane immunogenic protein